MKNLNNIKSFIDLHKNEVSILTVILFSSIIAILLIYINTSEEILGHSYRDIYFYLIQGLRFAGYSIEGYDYVNYLSPIIPFLSSILFRLGFINETSIFIVTGIFYPLGVIGTYLLLKLRFNNMLSVFGAILYGSFSINLMWTSNGTIDIPSVALSIWAIYLMILAVDKNQKYFYLAFSIITLAFFTKYTAGLVFPLMIIYLLTKTNIGNNIKKYFKNGIGGLIFGLATAIPFLVYFYTNNIPLGFINQAQDIATTTTIAIGKNVDLSNNLFYYFTNLPRFIYNPNHILSWFILAIGIFGLSVGVYKSIKLLKNRYDNSKKFNNGKIEIANMNISSKFYYILILINIIIIGISFLTASKVSFIYSEAIFFIAILIFSFLMNKILNIYSSTTRKNFNYDLLMFAWFFSYIIFFSAHLTKVDRYFTTMAPSFTFFIVLGLKILLNNLNNKDITKKLFTYKLEENDKKDNETIHKVELQIKNVVPIAMIAILLISSFGYLTIDKYDPVVHDEKEIVKWIILNDPKYESKVIWADRGPIFTWYLKKEVIYVNWLSKPPNLSNDMVNNNTTYYISLHQGIDIPKYSEIKQIGKVSIYKKTDNN